MQDENYSDLRGMLANIRTLRKALKGTDLDLLNEYVEKLTVVRDEAIEEHKQYQNELITKNEARNKARSYLEEAGLPVPDELKKEYTINDLLGIEKKAKRKAQRKGSATTLKPKYAIKDGEGNWQVWAGRGHKPKWFTEALESGLARSDLEELAQEYNLEHDDN